MRTFETRRADSIPFSEALDRVLRGSPPLTPRTIPPGEAAGLAAASKVRSTLTLPPGPTSHMDGYVVRAVELVESERSSWPRTFRVVGDSLPGAPWTHPMLPGSAVRIMTGALLPEEADRVFPVEDTDGESASAGQVRIGGIRAADEPWSVPGRHVRPPGEEVREGELLAAPGDTLEFGLLGLLATSGAGAIEAHPRPRVALVATGSELVPPGSVEALERGIRRADILSTMLPLLIRAGGAAPLPPHRVADEPGALRAALEEASEEADLIVTTGGASMGTADLVKDVLDDLGFVLDFWRIRMRPGSPVSFGHLSMIPVLGLPGNPVSAVVSYLVLGHPAVRARGGHRGRHLPRIRAAVREPLPGPDHLTRFFRVALEPEGEGRWGARPAAPQGSGVIRSLALADGLAVVPEGAPSPQPGTKVEVLLVPRAGWPENR